MDAAVGATPRLELLRSEAETKEETWLAHFHAGERKILEQCYREHFDTVARAVAAVAASSVDRESLIHDVFEKLFCDGDARRGFRGGSFAAWISRVARNRAIDHLRRIKREQVTAPNEVAHLAGCRGRDPVSEGESRDLIGKFRDEVLPSRWTGVFVARFVEERDQRDAARRLGIARTTLAYREVRIRALLKRFVREQA